MGAEEVGIDPEPLFAAVSELSTDSSTPGGCESLAQMMRNFESYAVVAERRGNGRPYREIMQADFTSQASASSADDEHQAKMAESNVTLTIRYEERDFVRAMRAHFKTFLRLWLDVVAIVTVGGYGIYLVVYSGKHWLGGGMIAAAAALAFMLAAAFLVIPQWTFRHEPKFRDEYMLTFSDEGIHFRTAHIDSRLDWSIYSRVLVDACSYLLYHGPRQFTIIPKRVFESAGQQGDFERLLAEHISRIDGELVESPS